MKLKDGVTSDPVFVFPSDSLLDFPLFCKISDSYMAIESKLNRGPIGRPMGQPEEKKKTKSAWIWVIVTLIIITAGVIWYATGKGQGTPPSDDQIATGEYQAVFLDNGQVYFGKLKTRKGDFYSLTDVFYIQTGAVGLDQASSLALVKLGNEAHGPEDKMEINKEHVLFVEDMKSDSKVVKAIQDYKSKKK
jgi:hypothetical protein